MLKSESFQLRLTKPQMARLNEVMHATGLGKAEHIRRAVDYYLAGWRQNAQPSQEPAREQPAPLAETPAPVPVSASKAPVYRAQDMLGQRVKVARR